MTGQLLCLMFYALLHGYKFLLVATTPKMSIYMMTPLQTLSLHAIVTRWLVLCVGCIPPSQVLCAPSLACCDAAGPSLPAVPPSRFIIMVVKRKYSWYQSSLLLITQRLPDSIGR